MSKSIILAIVTPMPFAFVEWLITAAYVRYWFPRPSSIWKTIALLIFLLCPYGFLFAELHILPFTAGYEKMAGYIFYIEAIGTILVTAILSFTLAYKQSKSSNPQKSTQNKNRPPAISLVLGSILVAILTSVLFVALLRDFIEENSWLASTVFGPLLGLLLMIFGIPLCDKTHKK